MERERDHLLIKVSPPPEKDFYFSLTERITEARFLDSFESWKKKAHKEMSDALLDPSPTTKDRKDRKQRVLVIHFSGGT